MVVCFFFIIIILLLIFFFPALQLEWQGERGIGMKVGKALGVRAAQGPSASSFPAI